MCRCIAHRLLCVLCAHPYPLFPPPAVKSSKYNNCIPLRSGCVGLLDVAASAGSAVNDVVLSLCRAVRWNTRFTGSSNASLTAHVAQQLRLSCVRVLARSLAAEPVCSAVVDAGYVPLLTNLATLKRATVHMAPPDALAPLEDNLATCVRVAPWCVQCPACRAGRGTY